MKNPTPPWWRKKKAIEKNMSEPSQHDMKNHSTASHATPKGRARPFRGLALALLVGLTSTLFACSTFKEKEFKSDTLDLKYQESTVLGSETKSLPLDHPLEIAEKTMREHLLSLVYEELHLLSKKKYLFSEEDAGEVARILTKALRRAPPHKVIQFTVKTKKGDTVGKLFASQKKLHWIFSRINGLRYSNNPNPSASYGRVMTNWKMIPQAGQSYHRNQKLLGKFTREDWIASHLRLPGLARSGLKKKKSTQAPAAKAPSGKSRTGEKKEPAPDKPASSQENPEFEEKLKFLKQLHDKKLIDDDEYEKKKKELMDEFF